MSSPELWAHGHARQNADNFGSVLGLCVLDRIQQSGQVTSKDLEDLHRVLGPYVGVGATEVPPLSQTLVGPLTSDKLSTMTAAFFDRYVDPDGAFPLNMESQQASRTTEDYTSAQTGAEKLQVLHGVVKDVLASQYMGPNNLTAPLSKV